jgi:20S proteasome subunit beta 1
MRHCAIKKRTFDLLCLWLSLMINTARSVADELQLGTTLVAVKFDHGVVVAADTRTSMSTFVTNRFADKLERITDHLSMARSGSAADTQELARRVRDGVVQPLFCRYGTHLTTREIAHWLRRAIVKNEKKDLSVGLLLAGCDPDGHPEIYTISQTGALLCEKGKYAAGGSGSVYVMGYLDERLHRSTEITEDEAMTLCQKAIETAILRDGSSGGMIRLHVVTRQGTRVETRQVGGPNQQQRDGASVPGFAERITCPVPTVNKRQSFVL